MNYFSSKQYNMLTRMLYFLNGNKEMLVKGVPAFKKIIFQYAEKMKEVRRLSRLNASRVEIAGAKKREIKAQSIAAIHKLAVALKAYAQYHKNKTLLQKVDYSKSDLSRPRKEVTAERFLQIMIAAKRTKGLSHFGIQPRHLQQAREKYEEFLKVIELPAIARSKKAASARQLNKMIKSCIWMLENEIDLLMEIALEEKKSLMKEYRKFRRLNFVLSGRRSEQENRYRASRKYKPGSRKKKKNISVNRATPSRPTVKKSPEVVASETKDTLLKSGSLLSEEAKT